jgi:hypothetical protein
MSSPPSSATVPSAPGRADPVGQEPVQQPGPDQVLLASGSEHTSLGGQYSYRVLGACCRLFDREELPWPIWPPVAAPPMPWNCSSRGPGRPAR